MGWTWHRDVCVCVCVCVCVRVCVSEREVVRQMAFSPRLHSEPHTTPGRAHQSLLLNRKKRIVRKSNLLQLHQPTFLAKLILPFIMLYILLD